MEQRKGLFEGDACVDSLLGDSGEFGAERSEFGVEGGFDVVVEGVGEEGVGGEFDDADRELDDLGAGEEFGVLLAGGFEVEDQEVGEEGFGFGLNKMSG